MICISRTPIINVKPIFHAFQLKFFFFYEKLLATRGGGVHESNILQKVEGMARRRRNP